uniref:Phospholipase A(2) n=1 Tax=Globodera rostochiensis TaxID=31243 RepID=A0A914HUJ0_GLORO
MHFLFICSLFFANLAFCFGQNSTLDTIVEEEIKLDAEWACGTDIFSKLLAESTVEKDCPEKKNAINNCCVTHDKCYDALAGRESCDDKFCACVDSAAAGNDVCSKEDMPHFCNLVREFGGLFYNTSANSEGQKLVVPTIVNGKKNKRGIRRK